MKSLKKKAMLAMMALALIMPVTGLKASSDDSYKHSGTSYDDHGGRGRGGDDYRLKAKYRLKDSYRKTVKKVKKARVRLSIPEYTELLKTAS